LLERVQHRFTRMVPGMKQLPYHTRLAQLGLWTLKKDDIVLICSFCWKYSVCTKDCH